MRFEGQAKSGFYPTPPAVYQRISKYLTCAVQAKGILRLLDPCAGTGEPLAEIARSLDTQTDIETYGIEVNQDRADQASQVLTKVIQTDFQTTRISHHSFGLLYLNPPYDNEIVSSDENLSKQARYEATFLKDSIRYLIAKGVLVYIIPRPRLNFRIARMLSYHFSNIEVYRFPSDLYSRFKQIIILGTLKPKAERVIQSERFLIKVGNQDIQVPTFTEELVHYKVQHVQIKYVIPVCKNRKEILFATTEIEPDQLLVEVNKHGMVSEYIESLRPLELGKQIKPVMPMRRGHLAQALASGLMNGVVFDKNGENPLLVKGSTTKVVDERVEGDGKSKKVIKTDRVKIIVKAFNQNGELFTIE